MIVDSIHGKCVRKLPQVLRSAITGEVLFPWDVPVSRAHLTNDFATWRSEVAQLSKIDKAMTGNGPRVIYVEKNTRLYGKQSFPHKIVFEKIEDFLSFMNAERQWSALENETRRLKEKLPKISKWLEMPSSYKKILENEDKWEKLLEVCLYLKNRTPGEKRYSREIPLNIPTKFIEENTSILRELLDVVLSSEQINENTNDFFERFLFLKDSTRIRVRVPDSETRVHLFGTDLLSDVELPGSDLDNILSSDKKLITVFVIENLTTFLTFPIVPQTLVVLGGGFAVSTIQIDAFSKFPIRYWGDIDVQGFEILSVLRNKYPHTQSLMMDFQTLKDHQNLTLSGTSSQYSEVPERLTDSETALYCSLKNENLRLEQERIPSTYILQAIKLS